MDESNHANVLLESVNDKISTILEIVLPTLQEVKRR